MTWTIDELLTSACAKVAQIREADKIKPDYGAIGSVLRRKDKALSRLETALRDFVLDATEILDDFSRRAREQQVAVNTGSKERKS